MGQPALVTAVHADGTADVVFGDRPQRVVTSAMEAPAVVGDWLLVHSGVALLHLDPHDAAERRALILAITESQT